MTDRLTDEEIEVFISQLDDLEASITTDGMQPFHALDNARSALRQLREERKWRPIEEAPKDGTILDLLHPDFGRFTDCWWDDEHWVGLPLSGEDAASVTHFIRAPYQYFPQDGSAA